MIIITKVNKHYLFLQTMVVPEGIRNFSVSRYTTVGPVKTCN